VVGREKKGNMSQVRWRGGEPSKLKKLSIKQEESLWWGMAGRQLKKVSNQRREENTTKKKKKKREV